MKILYFIIFIASFTARVYGGPEQLLLISDYSNNNSSIINQFGEALCNYINHHYPNRLVCTNIDATTEEEALFAVSQSSYTYAIVDGVNFNAYKIDFPLPALDNMLTLYQPAITIITPEHSIIKDISNLAGHRVAITGKESNDYNFIVKLLNTGWVPVTDIEDLVTIGLEKQAESLCGGYVDAVVDILPHPNRIVSQMADLCPIKLISLSKEEINEFTRGNSYEDYIIPGGLYQNIDYNVQTAASKVILVGNEQADRATKALLVQTITSQGTEIMKKIH